MSGSDENSSRSSASSANCSQDENQEEEETMIRLGSGGDIISVDADEICTLDSLSLIGVDDLNFYEQRAGRFSAADSIPQEPGEPNILREDEDLVVLAPEHPLLANFHQSVFKHLSKQKDQLAHDIREMTAKVKGQRKESDNLAEKLYGSQQKVSRQHAHLDVKTENVAVNAELREELQKCMKELNGKYREETKYLHEAQSFEETLCRRLGDKTAKDNAARRKDEEAESKLVLLKRQSEKASLDRKYLIEEKKKQDEFVYKLTCQVTDLQSLIAQLNNQITAKIKESSQLEQAVNAAGKDLEEQSRDQHQLNQVWQRLLVTARIKDVEFSQLEEKKEALHEAVKIAITTTIEHRKGEEQEREKNDKLMMTLKRLQREKAQLEMQIAKEQNRVEDLQEQMDKANNMIGLTETDLKEIKRSNRSKESRKNFLENELTLLLQAQFELEKKILEALNEKTTKDKTVQIMIKQVDEMNLLLEQLDKEKAQKDMRLAHAELEVQKFKHEEAQMKQYLAQQTEFVKQAEHEIRNTEHELQTSQTELAVKQGRLNRVNTKLSQHSEKTGGKEMSPLETQLSEIEDKVKVLCGNIETSQKILLRKEVLLMDQNEKVNKTKNEIEHLQRSIENLQHKSRSQIEELEKLQVQRNSAKKKIENQVLALSSVDREIAKQKSSKIDLEKDNLLHFNEIQINMNDDEQKMLDLSEKLNLLGEERNHLYEELRLLQTEQVELEAKLSLATETKRSIERERGSQGEIAAMKSEIHRMEVRLSQLKRAQEKLKLDLDQCVLRRDSMVDSARVRSKKHSIANTAKLKSLRRFETIKYNNKQLKSKLDKYDSDKVSLKAIEQEIQGLGEELDQRKSDVFLLNEPLKAVAGKLHNLRILKKEKLEHLVHEQKVVRGLSDAKDGKYKVICKSETILAAEAEKQRVVHANLISIIESLQPDFPQYASQLNSTIALLKSIKINYPNLSATQSVQEADENSSVQ